MTGVLINQTVAILIDGNNIERSIHGITNNQSAMINFDKLIPKLLDGRGLNRLIYFREGKNISSKLTERLHNNYYGSVMPCHKSADIPLTIKATQLASKVDTIIIMSGDSDYIDLVNHLKSEGVRVEIAAVPKTTSTMLIDEADYFHPIESEDWFILQQAKKPSKRPIKRPTSKRKESKKS
ncbi:NYN domain-containing protein [Bacteriovorax sp. Seq25_V]|uniref:NYN domain-containing protein n=1 Tax=Bacteriovorax sp. Seq25_V TaxID=1201288 RepID=UPI000389E378|nr:NYN domain-containing protein [Bacteriovorax sp. Seq25_V]EQC43953.1 NYN domain protein [Bacteriovorax sp. Seq25_V]